MKQKLRILLFTLCGFVLLWCFWNWDVLLYGFRQAKGQLNVISNTIPVERVLSDPAFPDSLKQKIRTIQEIKKFAVDSLGLKPVGSYESYFDQKGKPILWVLTACPPYELKAYSWYFPILGTFQYKGFFDKELVVIEEKLLKEDGLEVRLQEVSAWSTLGYLNDPILSSMLYRNEGELASLIIHEITHGTLFLKSNLEFNENLADFVGDFGAKRFLAYKYGSESIELKKFEEDLILQERYNEHILRGTCKLDSLFQTFSVKNASNRYKDSLKYDCIDQIFESTDTLMNGKYKGRYKGRGTVNNAYFVAFSTYRSRQNEFEEQFIKDFNGNFAEYLKFLKDNLGNLGK